MRVDCARSNGLDDRLQCGAISPNLAATQPDANIMHYVDLPALIRDRKHALAKGPIALILIEDDIAVESTIQHHLDLGFGQVIVFCDAEKTLPTAVRDQVCRVDFDVTVDAALMTIVNAIIPAAPDQWIYYCYNAEYLFYPFSEDRSVGEMLGFVAEERRNVVASYVIDLYASDLTAHPTAVDHDDAHFDKSGYYALARQDPEGAPLERQVNVFGGLRWRLKNILPNTGDVLIVSRFFGRLLV